VDFSFQNLKNLKGKTVYVYLSRADKVIPYRTGKKLVEKMQENDINVILKENRYLGHYGTIINAYFFPDYLDKE